MAMALACARVGLQRQTINAETAIKATEAAVPAAGLPRRAAKPWSEQSDINIQCRSVETAENH
jgi:hypothetical protein